MDRGRRRLGLASFGLSWGRCVGTPTAVMEATDIQQPTDNFKPPLFTWHVYIHVGM